MSWAKRAAWLVLVLCASLVLLTGMLLTPWGARLLVSQLNGVAGIEMQYQQGSLWSGLTVSDVAMTQPGLQINASRLSVDISITALLKSEITLSELSADSLTVALLAVSASNDQSAPQAIQSPIPIRIKQLKINDLQLNTEWGQLQVAQLGSGLKFDNTLALTHTVIHKPQWQTAAQSNPPDSSSGFNPHNLTLPAIHLPPVYIPVDIQLASVTIAEPVIDDQSQIKSIQLSGRLHQHNIEIKSLVVDSTPASLTVQAMLSLTDSPSIDLQSHIQLQDATLPIQQIQASAKGSLQQLLTNVQVSNPQGGNLVVKGTVDLTQAFYPADLTVDARNWQVADAQLSSINAHATFSGPLNQFRASLSAKAKHAKAGPLELQLDASGEPVAVEVSRLSLNQAQLTSMTSGTLLWQQGWHWQGSSRLNLAELDSVLPDLRGFNNRVAGSLSHQFQFNDGHWQASFEQIDFQGQWLSLPLSLHGAVQLDDKLDIQLSDLRLLQGSNQISLSGRITQQQTEDIQVAANLPDLASFYPGLHGKLMLNGHISGTLQQPEAQFELDGTALGYGEWFSQGVDGEMTWQDKDDFNLYLLLSQAGSANHQVDKATLSLSGALDEHIFKIKTLGGEGQLAAEIHGKLSDNQWQGRWHSGRISSRYVTLNLLDPFDISANWQTQRYRLSAHCWAENDTKLCIQEARLVDNQLDWMITIEEVAVKPLLNRWVSNIPPLDTTSQLNIDLVGSWPLATLPTMTVTAMLTPADWQLNVGKKGTQLHINDLVMIAEMNPKDAQVIFNLDSPQLGKLNLQTAIKDLGGARMLDGNWQLDALNLKPFKDLSVDIDAIEGIVSGNAKLSGSLQDPQTHGKITLTQGLFALRGLPMRLENIEQTFTLNGQKADIDGSFKSGQGNGELSGNVQWLPDFRGNLALIGDNLTVAYQRDLRAVISPHLLLGFTPSQLDVAGKIVVPEAHVKIRKLPTSADTPSNDVIIVDSESSQTNQRQRIKLDLDVLIDPNENDKVYLDAFGLTTFLQGELSIRQRPQGLHTDGILRLVDGRYRAYGQNLLIRTGELQFNGPIEQPLISVEAIRNPDLTQDNVIAGLRLSGNINQPQISFFSEPGMDDAASLSYLLRGSAPDSGGSSQSQDAVFASMLMAAGLSRSENLIGKIGDTFGVDNLAMDASGQGDDTKLNLTGYIAPGVQLRYGIGIFNSAAEVAIRYELQPKLYIEAVSTALNTALDIYWRFSLDDDEKSKAPKPD
ncbi:translocation/assembly module TamB domain-containing protein [Bowmanella sp. JS7-9]|uniref:Translocation/assembly module TamB domain-containing protein n=1 Tax=Pseudobowmanella zhangzhouensis TaxID=1537679 RepID=A0ABW1XP18_9ALTE|nr:translocation/assembly module TamB domain-containing protein [Bowmanella sp. JS7-9]TBX23756.1 hypothetical protein TK45_06615 [Bowmanella sp. JS7-9]